MFVVVDINKNVSIPRLPDGCRGCCQSSSDLPAAALLHLALGTLLGVVLSPLAVDEVQTLGLDLTVNEGTDETGDDLLGPGVVVDLACSGGYSLADGWFPVEGHCERTVAGLVVLVGLHGLEGSGTADQLVGELGLVLMLGSVLEVVVVTSLL